MEFDTNNNKIGFVIYTLSELLKNAKPNFHKMQILN